ncbi:MAG: asparagine synthase (glutamine-hydrolyzing) [Pseudonocardiales bacterium]|nr:asparagine synthase (glutamine-hydrolyzing) [Pseudonocardiales bacterium]
MAEFAGWIDFTHDLPSGGGAVATMSFGLSAGRAEDARLRTRRGAAFALRPSSTAENAALVEESGCLLAFAGVRYDGEGTDATLRAYQETGERFVAHLDGSYALAVWDSGRRQLVLARDHMGTRPLYYHRLPTGVVFASRLDALLKHPSVEARLAADGLRMILGGIGVPGQTIYRGIHEVRAGHMVRFTLAGSHEHRYWALHAAEHGDDLATTIGRTRGLLEDAVARCTSDGRVCALLSGGLDSSTIAAICAQRSGSGVRTFAVDYVGYEKNFQPNIVRPDPDSPYVRDMVAHLRAEHTDIVLDTGDLTRPEVWDGLVNALDQPFLLSDVEPPMLLLYQAIRGEADIVLGGEGADEIFGGYPWFHHPQWSQAPDFPWALTSDLLVGTLFGPTFEALEVRTFRADQYRQALAEIPGLPDDSDLERRMRAVVYLFVTRFLPEKIDRSNRLGTATGLDLRFPFCDHRLIEYTLNIPWSMKTFDGREKSILRAASDDLLPRSIVERRKSGYPLIHDRAYDHALRQELGRLYGNTAAPVRSLIDIEVLRAVYEDPHGDGDVRLSRIEMEFAIKLNAWLEQRNLALPSGD